MSSQRQRGAIVGEIGLSDTDWLRVYQDAFAKAIERRIHRTPFGTIIASEAVPPGEVRVYPPLARPPESKGGE